MSDCLAPYPRAQGVALLPTAFVEEIAATDKRTGCRRAGRLDEKGAPMIGREVVPDRSSPRLCGLLAVATSASAECARALKAEQPRAPEIL